MELCVLLLQGIKNLLKLTCTLTLAKFLFKNVGQTKNRLASGMREAYLVTIRLR